MTEAESNKKLLTEAMEFNDGRMESQRKGLLDVLKELVKYHEDHSDTSLIDEAIIERAKFFIKEHEK